MSLSIKEGYTKYFRKRLRDNTIEPNISHDSEGKVTLYWNFNKGFVRYEEKVGYRLTCQTKYGYRVKLYPSNELKSKISSIKNKFHEEFDKNKKKEIA